MISFKLSLIKYRAWSKIYKMFREAYGDELFQIIVPNETTSKGEQIRTHCEEHPELISFKLSLIKYGYLSVKKMNVSLGLWHSRWILIRRIDQFQTEFDQIRYNLQQRKGP